MNRIEGQIDEQAKLAKQALSWIVCARRRLRITELEHALAVEIGEPAFDPDNMSGIDHVVSLCAGLVTVDRESNTVHYTTQEYFQRSWQGWFPAAHRDIAMTCVTYLSYDAFEDVIAHDIEHGQAKGYWAFMTKFCLYDYACRNWGHHVREQPVPDTLVMRLLKDDTKVVMCAQPLKMPLGIVIPEGNQDPSKSVKGIFVAAYFGLDAAVKIILEGDPANAKLRHSGGRTPLFHATDSGRESTVKLLLDKGAGPNSDGYGYSPLMRAIENRHLQIAWIFLERGADPGTPKAFPSYSADQRSFGSSQSPLSLAVRQGWGDMVGILLKLGADPNFQNWLGESPLSLAMSLGKGEIVSLLIQSGASMSLTRRIWRLKMLLSP
ncbi:ankyrin repeat domain-containing protein [Aspergillus glaucus CBS 516.65]|uniref:GPI inositol-deacylase winged helix domain-containing protein n=1 Tax=Aspergillus glaucus CBS 516.65 TaxID=1160497 RepID=A0A1L9VZF2_ASPGL|nr:hypothetical protein ASPGLDRAFT_31009 [Aspergillus glaucus CBS 516.65]OJJ89298.1 hypothetical protein ASPGLDRAFT_31009 [Aspergillus glaucus CBS 516.65]